MGRGQFQRESDIDRTYQDAAQQDRGGAQETHPHQDSVGRGVLL